MRLFLPPMFALVLSALLVSCGQQGTDSDGTITVDGTVRGLVGGLQGAHVAGGDDVTVTSAQGEFTLEEIEVPYDLVVYTGTSAHLYPGLTTPTPRLLPIALEDQPRTYRTGTVIGKLSQLVPADHEAKVCVEGLSDSAYRCSVVAAGEEDYSIDAILLADSVDIRVHALLMGLNAEGVPDSYPAYGTAEGSAVAGETRTVHVTLGAAPPTRTLSGSVVLPAGQRFDQIIASVRVSEDYVMPILIDSSPPASSFSYLVPNFGHDSHQLSLTARAANLISSAWRSDFPSSGAPAIAFPSPLSLISPAAGASDVDTSTPFTVDDTNGRMVTFIFRPTPREDGPAFAITTAEPTVTIPDLASLGLSLPSGVTYRVMVPPAPSHIDDPNEAAEGWQGDYADALVATNYGGPAEFEDGSFAYSFTEFTTR